MRLERDDLVDAVADDGRGFDPTGPAGIGLRSMRERAAALGGELKVGSRPAEGPGCGFGPYVTYVIRRLRTGSG